MLPAMRRGSVIAATVCLALTACGGDGDEDGAAAPEPSPSRQSGRDLIDRQARSANALALSTNLADAARFCVRKIGAEQGIEQPPPPQLREAKDRLLSNAESIAREMPDLQINGQPLSLFLTEAAGTLRNGQCDTEAAARLEDLALSLP